MENPEGYVYRWPAAEGARAARLRVVLPAPDPGMPDVEPGLADALAALPERQRVAVCSSTAGPGPPGGGRPHGRERLDRAQPPRPGPRLAPHRTGGDDRWLTSSSRSTATSPSWTEPPMPARSPPRRSWADRVPRQISARAHRAPARFLDRRRRAGRGRARSGHRGRSPRHRRRTPHGAGRPHGHPRVVDPDAAQIDGAKRTPWLLRTEASSPSATPSGGRPTAPPGSRPFPEIPEPAPSAPTS